jgi:hypothetical protein
VALKLPVVLDQGLPTFLGGGQLGGAYSYNGHFMTLMIKIQTEIIKGTIVLTSALPNGSEENVIRL